MRYVVSVLGIGMLSLLTAQSRSLAFGDPIDYGSVAPAQKIARLESALRTGSRSFSWTPEHGYLESLLAMLEIEQQSQVLVFSKTSFQNDRIGPARPRAIYFGDDAYVGWVQGGSVMEITVVDPVRGPMFYVLDQARTDRPVFRRETDQCLRCHGSAAVDHLPANLVRSVHPDARGLPSMKNGSYTITHESPLVERWGGWYVTGSTGGQAHMGNRLADPGSERLEPAVSDLKDLEGLVDLSPYLEPHSDVVALMVFEHQAEMQNRIAHGSYTVRIALHWDAAMPSVVTTPSASTSRRIRAEADRIVRYLLLSDEAPLVAKVVGSSGFREKYIQAGPRDATGRSLRELDLVHRLFRYPCSPVIYSQGFDALPQPLLTAVYKKLWRVLIGKTRRAPFGRMSDADRLAVLQILKATKKNLPTYWHDSER